MILLTDSWNRKSQLLQYSLEQAGFTFQSISILYDGYIPEDVISPYQYYIERRGDGRTEGGDGSNLAIRNPGLIVKPDSDAKRCRKDQRRPLYFDELQVPENWEIRGTNSSGRVMDYEKERARIFYADPKSRRHIRIVDWLDEEGEVRFSDHYDRLGYLIARTVVSEKRMVLKSWFDRDGREVLTENFATGAILLREDGRERAFANRAAFVRYYLQETGADTDCIYYNSLSTPYFVVRDLPKPVSAAPDILFWQEPIRDTIPGNMIALFNGGRQTRIAVQARDAYAKLHQKVADRNGFGKSIANPAAADAMLRPVGFVYPYREQSQRNKRASAGDDSRELAGSGSGGKMALIVTNSDQVESLEQLIQRRQDVIFHVAALTEMSERLLVLERYPNVRLHPASGEDDIIRLIGEADVYLDINHGEEVLDSVYHAFLENIPVLAFDSTAHNRAFTGAGNIFPAGEQGTAKMADAIHAAVADLTRRKQMMLDQKVAAMDETAESFRKALQE